MADIISRVSNIGEYLKDKVDLSDENIDSIRNAINQIHQASPTEAAGVFSRMERLISASDDLSWVITCIRRKRNEIFKNIRSIKDPQFTILVRQGRPSTQAIEAEIHFNNKELSEIEEIYATLGNIDEYLSHILDLINNYNWALKDKVGYFRSSN